MITTDMAFDMIPYITEIYEKIDKKQFGNIKEKTMEETGSKAIKMILKSTPLFKNEIYGIVSLIYNIPVDTIRAQSPGKTLKEFKEIYNDIANDEDLISFFKEAVPSAMKK